jgi:hypothetical protein
MEFHATAAEIVQHRYQVARAAAQPVELPRRGNVPIRSTPLTARRKNSYRYSRLSHAVHHETSDLFLIIF